MNKVYLLSSGKASSVTISTVAERLKLLNVELVSDIKDCQTLIILPGELNDVKVIIGRGIYSKIKEFVESDHKKDPGSFALDKVYVITDLPIDANDSLRVSNISEVVLTDETDWTRYGFIHILKSSNKNVKLVLGNSSEESNSSNKRDAVSKKLQTVSIWNCHKWKNVLIG